MSQRVVVDGEVFLELETVAEVFRVDGEHDAVAARADRFVPQLLRAIGSAAG